MCQGSSCVPVVGAGGVAAAGRRGTGSVLCCPWGAQRGAEAPEVLHMVWDKLVSCTGSEHSVPQPVPVYPSLHQFIPVPRALKPDATQHLQQQLLRQ